MSTCRTKMSYCSSSISSSSSTIAEFAVYLCVGQKINAHHTPSHTVCINGFAKLNCISVESEEKSVCLCGCRKKKFTNMAKHPKTPPPHDNGDKKAVQMN
jgi:hypothetical protein